MSRFSLVALGLVAALLSGCSGCSRERSIPIQRGAPPPTIQVQANISADDFDMGLLATMVRDNKIQGNVAGIEAYINSAENPVNYVDTDRDGKIDYVKVTDQPAAGTTVLEFTAYKSSSPSAPDADTVIGTLKFTQQGQNYVIEGGYAPYVVGGANAYVNYAVPYSTGMSFGEAYLLAHLLAPRAMYVSRWGTPGYAYSYRPSVSTTVRTTYRTNYVTANRITPITRSTAPSTYNAGPRATMNASRFAPRQTSGSGLTGRTGTSSSFNRTPVSSGSTRPSSFTGRSSSSGSSAGPSRSSSSGSRSFGGGSRSFGGRRR